MSVVLGVPKRALLIFAIVAAVVSTGPATGQASVRSVAQGFANAVTLYCLPNVIDGTSLPELMALDLPADIEPASAARLPGRRAWVISGLGEIVTLETSRDPTSCSVSAYGPPVGATFDALATGLTQQVAGFSEQDAAGNSRGVTRRRFEIARDGARYQLVLSGNEPGAPGTRSRFSTLTATVSRQSGSGSQSSESPDN
jgi:hypothetical protein